MYVTYSTATISSTREVGTASTYSTQSPTTTGGAIPLSTTSTGSIEYNTSTDTTYTYDSTYTADDVSPLPTGFPSTTLTYTAVTTFSEGTKTTTYTQSSIYGPGPGQLCVHSVGTTEDPGFTAGLTHDESGTVRVLLGSIRWSRCSWFNPASVSYKEAAVGQGFQAFSSVGYGRSYGTGLSGGIFSVQLWGSYYPGLVGPVLDTASRQITVSGSKVTTQYVPSINAVFTTQSSSNSTTSRVDDTGSFSITVTGSQDLDRVKFHTGTNHIVGGYGFYTGTDRFTTLSQKVEDTWTSFSTTNSFTSSSSSHTTTESDDDPITTYTVTITDTTGGDVTLTNTFTTSGTIERGVHRRTYQNSTHSTSSGYQDWGLHSTSSIKRSEGIGYETAAAASSSQIGNDTSFRQYLNFPAFPEETIFTITDSANSPV